MYPCVCINTFLFPAGILGLGGAKLNNSLQRSCTSQDIRNGMQRLLHSSIDHNAHSKYDLGYYHDTTVFLDETGRTISKFYKNYSTHCFFFNDYLKLFFCDSNL